MALKKCKECGKEISSSAKECPSCGKDQRNWFMRHKFLTGLIVIFLFIGVAAAGGDSEPTEKIDSNNDSVQEEQVDTEEVKEEKKSDTEKTYEVGDQVKMGEVILTVNEVDNSTGGQYTTPSEGNEWINLNLTIENTGSSQEFVTTMGQMYIVDTDGNQYSVAVTNKAMENPNNSLDGAIVAKAKKTGWVGFEVPKKASDLTFRYNASFWNDKAILVNLNQ